MTFSEQMYRLNVWYDGLPEQWRFHYILWPLVALGLLNMLMTLGGGFPFGLLVLLGIVCVALIRVSYVTGWAKPADPAKVAAEQHAEAAAKGHGPEWMADLNARYMAMPENERFWVIPVILVVFGLLNMLLTLGGGFPFGLLFLLALLAILVVRVPYATGYYATPEPRQPAVSYDRAIGHAPLASPMHSEPAHAEPAAASHQPEPLVAAPPPEPHHVAPAEPVWSPAPEPAAAPHAETHHEPAEPPHTHGDETHEP